MHKYIFTILLATLCTLPMAAQVSNGGTNHERPAHKTGPAATAKTAVQPESQTDARLNTHVERAVAQATRQAQPQTACSCKCCHACAQSDEPEIPVIFTQEPLSTHELIEAEEELSILRSRKDSNATFEKYPYLLDPAYRRAENDAQKSRIRAHYSKDEPAPVTPSYNRGQTWAAKVGL